MADNGSDGIEISQMIIELRKSLEAAQQEGDGKSVQFIVNETELELNVKISGNAKTGIKFYVFEVGAGVSSEQSQKMKIKLQPIVESNGRVRKLKINDDDTR